MIVATSPDEVITVLSQALRDGRVVDALALFEPDAVFISEPGAHPIAGREAIHAALTTFAALRPTMTSDIRKVVMAGDVATVLNAWQLRGTGPDGNPITMSATSADVMRRRPDGTWAILIDDPWGA